MVAVTYDEAEWCSARVMVDGYYRFECSRPRGHAMPHRLKLGAGDQADPVVVAGEIEWQDDSEKGLREELL